MPTKKHPIATSETKKAEQPIVERDEAYDYETAYNEIIIKERQGKKLSKYDRVFKVYMEGTTLKPKAVANRTKCSETYARSIKNKLVEMGWRPVEPELGEPCGKKDKTLIKKAMDGSVEDAAGLASKKKLMSKALKRIEQNTVELDSTIYDMGSRWVFDYGSYAQLHGLTSNDYMEKVVEFHEQYHDVVPSLVNDNTQMRDYIHHIEPIALLEALVAEKFENIAFLFALTSNPLSNEELMKLETTFYMCMREAVSTVLQRLIQSCDINIINLHEL